MPTLIETFDITQILQPMQRPEDARQDAVVWGPNLTITKGEAVGIKTADGKAYPLNTGANDGTQTFKGFAMYTFTTDANGNVFYGPTAAASYRTGPWRTSPIWIKGIFNPLDLQTAAAPTAQVDTFTPANVEIGDIFTLTYTAPTGDQTAASFTATAATAANAAAGLVAAWNANPTLAAVATATGTVTVILTATNAGTPFTVASSTTDGGGANTQTLTRAATTAAAGRAIADILGGAPGARVLHNGFWEIP